MSPRNPHPSTVTSASRTLGGKPWRHKRCIRALKPSPAGKCKGRESQWCIVDQVCIACIRAKRMIYEWYVVCLSLLSLYIMDPHTYVSHRSNCSRNTSKPQLLKQLNGSCQHRNSTHPRQTSNKQLTCTLVHYDSIREQPNILEWHYNLATLKNLSISLCFSCSCSPFVDHPV